MERREDWEKLKAKMNELNFKCTALNLIEHSPGPRILQESRWQEGGGSFAKEV